MELMETVYRDSGLQASVERGEEPFVKGIMENMRVQREKLDKEVKKYCAEREA
jgi:hypothetical protein